MKWLALCLLLAGCGDTIHFPCDRANIPGPPTKNAVRSMQEDQLFWTWKVYEADGMCLVTTEVWVWESCSWRFDRYLKTRVDCGSH